MTVEFLVLVILSQAFMVGGQIFLKHAMNKNSEREGEREPGREGTEENRSWVKAMPFVYGIGLMTLWFLLWFWLLSKVDLSYLYPFDALSPLFMAFGASVALKEKMTPRLWFGVLLIVGGLLIVGASQ